MRYRLKLIWCWVKHVGRNVEHYRRLFRWWRRGAHGHKPIDVRFFGYSGDRCLIELERWLEWQRREEGTAR